MSADLRRADHGADRRLGALVPLDLIAVLATTAFADAIVLVSDVALLRFLAATGLLLFLPGYAVVAALYPRGIGSEAVSRTAGSTPGYPDTGGDPVPGETGGDHGDATDRRGGIDGVERVVLAFGVSLALVPLVGLVIWTVGLSVSAIAVALSLSVVVVIAVVVGFVRRLVRPAERRFAIPVGRWAADARRAVGSDTPVVDRLLAVALAGSVLVAGGALVYALASPPVAAGFTAAALLAPGADGPVASGYPSEFTAGEPQPLVLEFQNRQLVETTFAVVVRAERVDVRGAEPTVTEASELDRLSLTVPAGETVRHRHNVAPDLVGDRIRLTYYVYHGEAPATPSAASADRVLYIWVSVDGA